MAVEGSTATVGITDFAARALGDVVFVSLPAQGLAVTAEEPCGEVESTKSVSDLYSPVDGEVTRDQRRPRGRPGPGQLRPLRGGWMFQVQLPAGGALLPGTLSPAEYEELTKDSGLTLAPALLRACGAGSATSTSPDHHDRAPRRPASGPRRSALPELVRGAAGHVGRAHRSVIASTVRPRLQLGQLESART